MQEILCLREIRNTILYQTHELYQTKKNQIIYANIVYTIILFISVVLSSKFSKNPIYNSKTKKIKKAKHKSQLIKPKINTTKSK